MKNERELTERELEQIQGGLMARQADKEPVWPTPPPPPQEPPVTWDDPTVIPGRPRRATH